MLDQPLGRLSQGFSGAPHRLRQVRQRPFGRLSVGFDLVENSKCRLATIHQFARHKVHRLNPIGALVNRGDAHIAAILGRTRFLDKAHAAVHLHPCVGNVNADIGAKSLANRGQKRGPRPPCVITCGHRHINRHGIHQRDSAGCKYICLHTGQHAAHIGVFNNCTRARGLALLALDCIGQSVLICAFCRADPLHANPKTGVVHHGKHRRHTAVFRPHQPAGRTGIIHHCGGRAVQPHFMFQADNTQVVLRPRRAIGIRDQFGHHKQADPLGARHTVGQARKHKVTDVFGEIIVGPTDVNLLARDRIGPVTVRFGLGAQGTHVRSGLRFGQIHRAAPRARNQFGQVNVLERIRGVMLQRLDLALGHQRI